MELGDWRVEVGGSVGCAQGRSELHCVVNVLGTLLSVFVGGVSAMAALSGPPCEKHGFTARRRLAECAVRCYTNWPEVAGGKPNFHSLSEGDLKPWWLKVLMRRQFLSKLSTSFLNSSQRCRVDEVSARNGDRKSQRRTEWSRSDGAVCPERTG